ncbi:hypothetical protein chiPu_0026744, partial [Chiloscyllium punctatum]|nr:hypothetical protein [Chiloscyllium punctatum]
MYHVPLNEQASNCCTGSDVFRYLFIPHVVSGIDLLCERGKAVPSQKHIVKQKKEGGMGILR